jgi:hypothetical protein
VRIARLLQVSQRRPHKEIIEGPENRVYLEAAAEISNLKPPVAF